MKHSSAQKVYFAVSLDGNSLRFVVEDDGVGFDPDDPKEGVGITNIERRADLFGGSVKISSKPGKGTRTEGSIPLGKELEA